MRNTVDCNKKERLDSSELSNEVMEGECLPGAMLSDIVITYAQMKLKCQWNDLRLQNTLLGQNLQFTINKKN